MTDFALHLAAPASHALWRPSVARRLAGSVRYAGVLVVFGLFFLVRPPEAAEIFRHRRWNSPLRGRLQR
jgi:hypothetical protein